MRTDQMIGLSPRAQEIVKGLDSEQYTIFEGAWNTMTLDHYGTRVNDTKLLTLKKVLKDCKDVDIPIVILKSFSVIEQWLDDLDFTFHPKYKEVVQAEPWSSGPCYFLCLEDMDGNRCGEWTQEEIDREC